MMKKLFVLLFMFAAIQGAVLFNGTLAQHFSAAAEEVLVGGSVRIDTATKNDGYFTARVSSPTSKKIVIMVSKGESSCTYTLDKNGKKDTFPLQYGDGEYTVRVLENVSGTQYAVLNSQTLTVKYSKANAPFLIPMQLVDYKSDSETVKKAAELCANAATDLDKLNAIYTYVVNNLSYDTTLAQQISAGTVTTYIPVVDSVLSSQKGICYDYSSLMAAMLRSQGVPTRLVMGYVAPNNIYHAWNEVYIQNVGWVKLRGDTYFNGTSWTRMDSTFASTSSNQNIAAFIGTGTNYKTSYFY